MSVNTGLPQEVTWHGRDVITTISERSGAPLTTVQDSFDLHPATIGGTISASILGNDQILWSGVDLSFHMF